MTASPLDNATYFASGSNLPGEIRGLAEINHPLGVAVQEMNELGLEELERLAGSGLRVFVDSGAFSEVSFTQDCPEGRLTKKGKPVQVPCAPYVKPGDEITAEEWDKRLAVYKRLAKALGSQLYVVAPDRVGCQQVTLERLETYREEVRELAAMGANVLLPLQRGELNPAEFLAFAKEVTGLDDELVPAFPMRKGATPHDVVADFVRDEQPRRLHLLGLGANNDAAAPLAARLYELCPTLDLMLDSVLIRSLAGRNNGPGGGPRLLTVTQDEAADELSGYYWGAPPEAENNMVGSYGNLTDYTDHVFEKMNSWLKKAGRERVAAAMGFDGDELKAWMKDPHGFYQEHGNDYLDVALDAEWAAFSFKASSAERKRRGVVKGLG
jgi:hypothetical protein